MLEIKERRDQDIKSVIRASNLIVIKFYVIFSYIKAE